MHVRVTSSGAGMGTEARTLFNLGIITDLSLRGPQLNLQRDPRWGRCVKHASTRNAARRHRKVTARTLLSIVKIGQIFGPYPFASTSPFDVQRL